MQAILRTLLKLANKALQQPNTTIYLYTYGFSNIRTDNNGLSLNTLRKLVI